MNFKENKTIWIATGLSVVAIVSIFIAWENSISTSFRCPNAYGTAEAYVTGVTEWAKAELMNSPTMTQEELLSERQRLFTENKCEPSRWPTLPDGL